MTHSSIPIGFMLACSLLGFTACENSKIDDQAAKELEQAGDKIERKAEQAGDAVDAKVDELRGDASDDLERAKKRMSTLDERFEAAKAKAKGSEANEELEADIAKAKAKVELEAEQAKDAAAEGASDAIERLKAALDDLDKKIDAYDSATTGPLN